MDDLYRENILQHYKNPHHWGELEDPELGALGRHWLLYDLAELGELEYARRRHAELERIAAELQQPLYRHSRLAWRGVWAVQSTGPRATGASGTGRADPSGHRSTNAPRSRRGPA